MEKKINACIALAVLIFFAINANAQESVSPTKPPTPGHAPGMKVKLVESSGTSKT